MSIEAQRHGITMRMMRKHAKLNQAQLAITIGTSNTTISKIETGTQEPTILQMENWAAACRFDLKVLVAPMIRGAT